MEQHVRLLAILNIVSGILGLIGAVFILIFFGGMAFLSGMDTSPDSDIGAAVLGGIAAIGFIAVAVFSVPSIIAGYGLLHFRSWAPTLTIVLSALSLISFPLGTALGIYGLWVLLNKDTKPLFSVRAVA